MSFGRQSGPPASAKQLRYLESLVQQAGFDGFRDARHPLGLTQRQAGGKFTKQEASALIDQLLAGDDEGGGPAADGGEPGRHDGGPAGGDVGARRRAEAASARLEAAQADAVRGMPAVVLATELERRGWAVNPPPEAPQR
ncbi:MAG: hypothetical protein MUE36_15315 [Acidimicrobiales bacterium]|jgi:PAS domain-containing protein|nr:hypothetical protein [Acidimicrobiales bacterium]